MPLRLRLALLFALGTAAVIAAAGLGFVLQLRVSLDASLDPGLRARVAAVADELRSGDPGAALPGVGQLDGVTQIRTVDGQLLAAAPPGSDRSLLDAAQRRQAISGDVSFTGWVGGDRSRVLATTVAAVAVPGGRALVVVSTGTDVSDAALSNITTALWIGGPPAVLLAGGAAWLLAGAVLAPVERMRRQAAEISDRDTGRRLPVPATRDEIAALGTTINALLARLQGALERQRGFVADAGHELRTPLAILRTELELAARPGRSRAALLEAIEQAGSETDRLIRLAEDLLLLARADNDQPFLVPQLLELPPLLDTAARAAATRGGEHALTLTVDTPPDLTVFGDPDRLRQALDNLLDNAVRHAPPGSTVELTARAAGGLLAITVADRGPGFPPQFLPHAFERFQRAEAARSRDGGGTGLGLAIVAAIAAAHGGRAVAENRPSGGAAVRLELPARTPTDIPSTAKPGAAAPKRRRR